MWICPKCGRNFKNIDQSHYCGDAPATIDEYIEQSPEEHREILQHIRETIRDAAPDAVERIAWRMPTFWQGEHLIHFAAAKNHMGLHCGEDGVNAFEKRLTAGGYKFKKGTIQIPWNKPVPYELIADITRFRVKQAESCNMASEPVDRK